jgi:hypothetical protein
MKERALAIERARKEMARAELAVCHARFCLRKRRAAAEEALLRIGNDEAKTWAPQDWATAARPVDAEDDLVRALERMRLAIAWVCTLERMVAA